MTPRPGVSCIEGVNNNLILLEIATKHGNLNSYNLQEPLKGNGDHSEVRDKFCSNFQNMLIRSL